MTGRRTGENTVTKPALDAVESRWPWHASDVVKASPEPETTREERTWFTVPDLVEVLGVGVGRVHRMLEDKQLLAKRVDGVLRVPADFIMHGQPISELRGTLIVLSDAGFTDDEAMTWLLEPEESMGTAPIDALRAGRKAEVRRIAQALA